MEKKTRTDLMELRKKLMELSDQERKILFGTTSSGRRNERLDVPEESIKWYQRLKSGLNDDGKETLRRLSEQNQKNPIPNQKRFTYLQKLDQMQMTVPAIFQETDPRKLYQMLKKAATEHHIPEAIIQQLLPQLVEFIATGHMRPILFVGEPGCGKTTTARLLFEALGISTEVVKIPQAEHSHGLVGECDNYKSADVGILTKARLRYHNLLVAYLFDEVDKAAARGSGRASLDDQLLSLTDESRCDMDDQFLETRIVGLEHCPILLTANDLDLVNPFLADRCLVIPFPEADAERLKAILHQYVEKKLSSELGSMIEMDYERLDRSVDLLVQKKITSIRKSQQLAEHVISLATEQALTRSTDEPVQTTEAMFRQAEYAAVGIVRRKIGFDFA